MIGMFDSGVGGLSIAEAIRELMPEVPITYVADQSWFPYGQRDREQIVARTAAITRLLIDSGARVVVVACNTASNAAIVRLREMFDVPFVGIEPAVKVASDSGQYARVGVLCTDVTANGPRYHDLLDRVAQGLEVVTVASKHLAGLVERGEDVAPLARQLVATEIQPLLDAEVEVIALGCTHYAFLAETIHRLSGLPVLEPSRAVARQVQRLYPKDMASGTVEEADPIGPMTLYTTREPESLKRFLQRHNLQAADVLHLDLE